MITKLKLNKWFQVNSTSTGKLFLHVMTLGYPLKYFSHYPVVSTSVNFNPVEVGTGKTDQVHAKPGDDEVNIYQQMTNRKSSKIFFTYIVI